MNLLTVGGSDPSGGAGIQSDIKTWDTLGAHGLSVITAVTAQNTTKFSLIEQVSQKILRDQFSAIFSDFKIEGIKISMVYNSKIIRTIAHELKNKKIAIVVDPVIKSTTGGMLLEKSALEDYKNFIIPLATIITPNKYETEFLTKVKIDSRTSLKKAAKKIQGLGAKNVIVTGIEDGNRISDFVFESDAQYWHSSTKIPKINHGSGCNYSSALIYFLASGKSIKEAAKFAKKYTQYSIKDAKSVGKGIAITQNKNPDKIFTELKNSIAKLTSIKNIYKNIPECQTNFVFSKKNPKSFKDVLGIEGRIVKTGTTVTLAGNLEYGGSKHVASALIAMNQKFPDVYSAINLKYQPRTIQVLQRNNFSICSYDRKKEPTDIKKREGGSVYWGIKNAIKNSGVPPDIVYHKGDFGKEPMIIIFGRDPTEILEKILKIINISEDSI